MNTRRRHAAGVIAFLLALSGCAAISDSPNLDSPGRVDSGDESPTAAVTPETPFVDAVDLLSAPIAESCMHPAGDLVDGYLPGIPEDEGGAGLAGSIVSELSADERSPLVAHGSTPRAAIASVVVCHRGGVGWPHIVTVWDADLRLAGYADLGAVTHGGRETIVTLEAQGEGFYATWITQGYGDAACCGTVSASATFKEGSTLELIVSDLEVRRGESQIGELLRAVSSGTTVADHLASEQAVDALGRLVELGWLVEPDSIVCDGGELGAAKGPWQSAAWGGGPTCWAETNRGSIVIGLSFGGWGEYRVETVYAS